MSERQKRVVITGPTGLIGRALMSQCVQNGTEVYAVVRPGSRRSGCIPDHPLVHSISCDLSELSTLPDLIPGPCDVFYHLGWGHTGRAKNGDVKYQTENINFTVDAVRAADSLSCHLFVGAGSQAEYGPKHLERISPETPESPVTAYGICKYAAGRLARLEGERQKLPVVWMRIFSTYGVGDKPDMLMGSLVRKMLRGEHISMTAGIQQWDYLNAEDAGRAFFLAGESCCQSAVYCLGSGEKRPLREYVEETARLTGYDQPVGYGEIPYTENSVMDLCADIRSLTRDTGFRPEISFSSGMSRLVQELKREEKMPEGVRPRPGS